MTRAKKAELSAEELGRILREEFDRDGWGMVDPSFFGTTPVELKGSDYDGLHEVLVRVAKRINER